MSVEEALRSAPTEATVTLPSRGRVYGDLLLGGEVRIRPWTTAEEKLILATPAAAPGRAEAVERLLDRCLLSREVPVADMLSGDRTYLLLQIRALTLWPEYTIQTRCSMCRHSWPLQVDLTRDLRVMALTEEDRETFDVELPVCGKRVTLRRLLGSDERAMEVYARQQGRRSSAPDALASDPTYNYATALCITAIDGEPADVRAAMALLETPPLHGRDSLLLRRALEDNDCGVQLQVDATCPSCGAEREVMVPLDMEFFRPRSVPE